MRYAGLDIGDKTIGVALSDPLFLTAQGLCTIRRKKAKVDIEALRELIEKYDVTLLVIGLPKNMNNTLGPQSQKVLSFVDLLKKEIAVDVHLEDERLTTVQADRHLIASDMRRENRRKVVDEVAATFILQTYLDRR